MDSGCFYEIRGSDREPVIPGMTCTIISRMVYYHSKDNKTTCRTKPNYAYIQMEMAFFFFISSVDQINKGFSSVVDSGILQ